MKTEDEIISTCLNEVAELLGKKPTYHPTQGEEPWDGRLEITSPQGRAEMPTEVRRNLNSSDIAHFERIRRNSSRPALLMAPHVTPARARGFRQDGIQFIDMAGNMNLDLPGLRVFVSGEPLPTEFRKSCKQRAWTESAIRCAYVILTKGVAARRWEIPLRIDWISSQALLSTGAASNARNWLIEKGFLEQTGRSQFMVLDRERLFDDWCAAYCERLYDRLLLGEIRATSMELDGMLGGESAARELVGILAPEIHTIYVAEPFSRWCFRHADKLSKPPTGKVVQVRQVFWAPAENARHTCPVLTYADLVASEAGRNLEAAREIDARFIHPTFG